MSDKKRESSRIQKARAKAMEASTRQKVWTYQEYLKLDDGNRYEIIGGELIMSPSPGSMHQFAAENLSFILGQHVRKKSSGRICYAPIDVVFNEGTPEEETVQPDILFIAGANTQIIKPRGIFGSPDLIVEIISPSSQYRDTVVKKAIYEKNKVAEYWLVDPYMKSIVVLTLAGKEEYELFSQGSLAEDTIKQKTSVNSKILPGLTVKLEEVFI